MSKFLLNLLLQISKTLVYSKIKFLFGKEFSFTFGPIGPAASRPSRSPLVLFQPAAPPLPIGPQPLGRPSSPSRPRLRRVGGALPDCCLPFEKAYFWKTAFPSRMRTPQKIYHLCSAHISRPGHNPPTGLGLPAGPNRLAHLASLPLGPRMPLAYFAEDIFFFDSRLSFSAPSLSPLADAWVLLVSSFLHPAPADPDCATTEPRCARPLRTAASRLEMPPGAITRPTITPPPIQVVP
jgi:hypothetical protein